jgi:hypothetical protein
MVLGGPAARPAAHRHPGQQHRLPLAGGLFQAAVDDHGRRWHHQLEPVLQVEA